MFNAIYIYCFSTVKNREMYDEPDGDLSLNLTYRSYCLLLLFSLKVIRDHVK